MTLLHRLLSAHCDFEFDTTVLDLPCFRDPTGKYKEGGIKAKDGLVNTFIINSESIVDGIQYQSPEKVNLPPVATTLCIAFLIIQHRYEVSHFVIPFSPCQITSFACIRMFLKPYF